jgi:hypothetical protein
MKRFTTCLRVAASAKAGEFDEEHENTHNKIWINIRSFRFFRCKK